MYQPQPTWKTNTGPSPLHLGRAGYPPTAVRLTTGRGPVRPADGAGNPQLRQRFLVLVDATRFTEPLRRVLAECSEQGRASFQFQVRVAPSLLHNLTYASECGTWPLFPVPYEDIEHEKAAGELFDELAAFVHERGATATGQMITGRLGRAALEEIRAGHFDRIIVSAEPGRLERWSHLDLPHQLRRSLRVPFIHCELLR